MALLGTSFYGCSCCSSCSSSYRSSCCCLCCCCLFWLLLIRLVLALLLVPVVPVLVPVLVLVIVPVLVLFVVVVVVVPLLLALVVLVVVTAGCHFYKATATSSSSVAFRRHGSSASFRRSHWSPSHFWSEVRVVKVRILMNLWTRQIISFVDHLKNSVLYQLQKPPDDLRCFVSGCIRYPFISSPIFYCCICREINGVNWSGIDRHVSYPVLVTVGWHQTFTFEFGNFYMIVV